jgi:hypothetical protein
MAEALDFTDKKSVLIVDDTPENLTLMNGLLCNDVVVQPKINRAALGYALQHGGVQREGHAHFVLFPQRAHRETLQHVVAAAVVCSRKSRTTGGAQQRGQGSAGRRRPAAHCTHSVPLPRGKGTRLRRCTAALHCTARMSRCAVPAVVHVSGRERVDLCGRPF